MGVGRKGNDEFYRVSHSENINPGDTGSVLLDQEEGCRLVPLPKRCSGERLNLEGGLSICHSLQCKLGPALMGKLLDHTQVNLIGERGGLASRPPGKQDGRFRHQKSLYLWTSGQHEGSCSEIV